MTSTPVDQASDSSSSLLPRADAPKAPLSSRDWLNLGVLCVAASDQAAARGDLAAQRYYQTLAVQCDEAAASKPQRVARGTASGKL